LERGRFLWRSLTDGVVTISVAQLSYLLPGIDWRMPQAGVHRLPDELIFVADDKDLAGFFATNVIDSSV
jgi:transposase